MRLQSTPSAAPPWHMRQGAPSADACQPRVVLSVAAIGYRVPEGDFTGHVHSVFAQACNLAVQGTLLTLVAPPAGNGPTALRLATRAPQDLRDLFDAGEPFGCRQRRLTTARVELCLARAQLWRPALAKPCLASSQIAARLAATTALLARRQAPASVIDRQAAPVVAELHAACQAQDIGAAVRSAGRLIGWGEGLTPAGDDFLVGLLAGLDAWPSLDAQRPAFRDALAAAITHGTPRTTAIAAHYLKLAAGGHFTEPLLDVRDALLGEPQQALLDAALVRALAVGATSGADTVSGLLAGLAAWLPSNSGALE